MNEYVSSLPGLVGYGVRGKKGVSGKNGVSYYYTPYTIQTTDDEYINDLNSEIIYKLQNNFTINKINSFDKLPDNREYQPYDIICDNIGNIYVYNIDGERGLHRISESKKDVTLNISSIFNVTNYFYNGYNRISNNKHISIDYISSNSKIPYKDIKDIYNMNVLDFNTSLYNTYYINSQAPIKVYKNPYGSLSFMFSLKDNCNYIKTNQRLYFDFIKMNIPDNTSLGDDRIYTGECITSILNRFKPKFVTESSFKIYLIDKTYYTFSFYPQQLFRYSENADLDLSNITMDVYTIYGDYKTLNHDLSQNNTTVIKDINLMDMDDFNRVRLLKVPNTPMYIYLKLRDNKTGLTVTSQISKNINK